MKPRVKKQLVVLQVSTTVVAAIDQIAERQERSRSDFIRQAVLKELAEQGLCPLAAA
jgi:metal-responsive CopG/Arc/MetJ family transcriptional regulator